MTASPILFVLSGLFVHGFAYTFFFMSVIIYLDHHCNKKSRSGVHQLFTIFSGGLGNFCGSILAGLTADLFMNKQNMSNFSYSHFWIVPIVIDVIVIIGLIFFFKNLEEIKHIKKI
jgi:MFS family permease